jgi:hypothetical protein
LPALAEECLDFRLTLAQIPADKKSLILNLNLLLAQLKFFAVFFFFHLERGDFGRGFFVN